MKEDINTQEANGATLVVKAKEFKRALTLATKTVINKQSKYSNILFGLGQDRLVITTKRSADSEQMFCAEMFSVNQVAKEDTTKFFLSLDSVKGLIKIIDKKDEKDGVVEITIKDDKRVLFSIKSSYSDGNVALPYAKGDDELLKEYSNPTYHPIEAKIGYLFDVRGSRERETKESFIKQLEIGLVTMAKQDIRFYLNGVLFELGDKKGFNIVSTDGHRLSLQTDNNFAVCDNPANKQFILKGDSVKTLLKLLKSKEAKASTDFDVVLSAKAFTVLTDKFIFVGDLIDGKFPQYSRGLPKNSLGQALINTQELKKAVELASLSTGNIRGSLPKLSGMRYTFNGDSLIIGEGDLAQQLDIELSGELTKLELGLNTSYVLDAIKIAELAGSKSIRLELTDSMTAVVFHANDEVCSVVMPMRL